MRIAQCGRCVHMARLILQILHIIFPKYGTPDRQKYYAIESSKNTRAMYERLGLPADPVGAQFNSTRSPYHENDVLL